MTSTVPRTLRNVFCGVCILLALILLIYYYAVKSHVSSSFTRLSIRKTYKFNGAVLYNQSGGFNNTISNSSYNSNSGSMRSSNNSEEMQNITLPLCEDPIIEKSSPFTPNVTLVSLDVINEQLGLLLEPGGAFQPKKCLARHHVAIVVPFRGRHSQLPIFLRNIHPFLMQQHIAYRIFIIEQTNSKIFNRAALMNIGFLEAMKLFKWDCFIFHDVDLLPLDNRNLYNCPARQPRHMSVAVNKRHYKLNCSSAFGGVSALSREHFVAVNGFSNSYFGWGSEADDMRKRLRHANLIISCYPPNIGRYMMLKHKKEKANPHRWKILEYAIAHIVDDGLNSIKYDIYSYKFYPTFSWYYADIVTPYKIFNSTIQTLI